jgi:hypothetical protein
MLKVTEYQLPVIQPIHKFSENVEVDFGVDGCVVENGATYPGLHQSRQKTRQCCQVFFLTVY